MGVPPPSAGEHPYRYVTQAEKKEKCRFNQQFLWNVYELL